MGTPRQRRIGALILLSTLLGCAFFLAQGVTQYAGSMLVVHEGVQAERPDPAAQAEEDAELQADREVDHERVRMLMSGPEPVTPDIGPGADMGPADTGPIVPVPCASSNATLTGTVVSSRAPEWSLASITIGDQRTLCREGGTIDGKEVMAITEARVYLREQRGVCYLAMFDDNAARPSSSRATASAASATTAMTDDGMDSMSSRESSDGTGGISTNEMEEGINRQSDRRFTIQRALLDRAIQNQSDIMRTARIIPHEEGGRVVGVKMYGIRRNSLLGRLGVQNGDMVRTINGFDLSSPDSALEAYTRLTGASNLSLSVVRRGQPMTIEYEIQ